MPVSDAPWLNILAAALTAGGLVLAVLGARAWWRYGELRFAMIFFAYLGFLVQGALVTWGLFARNRLDDLLVPLLFLTVLSLFLVHVATLVGSSARRAPGGR